MKRHRQKRPFRQTNELPRRKRTGYQKRIRNYYVTSGGVFNPFRSITDLINAMQQNTLPTPTITTKPRAHEHINFKRMRAWSYFRRELLYITWALMEVALIVPVSLAVMQWATWSPTTVAFGVLGVMLIPFYLARLMTWLKLPLRLQQQIMIGIALFTILWSIRSINYEMESAFDFSWISQFFTNLTVANSNLWQHDLGLFGLITLAWWRGTLLVSRTLDVVKFGLRFRRSSLYFAPLIILLAYFQLDWSILPFILLFFLAGLTAVTLTRAEQAELEQKAIIAAISPRWLTTVFSFSLGITLLASGISRFISGNFSGIFSLFTPVWQALRIGSISTGLTILYLISPLLDVFNAILEAIIAFWKWAFSRLFIPVDDPQTENTQEAVQD
ncbi:MAG: hypothetical protein GY943_13410, partial [Chloroflexi bacterium]|nr:hypothetical protein [Chloroflexota bacterium]